ncbi:MAG TPA: low-specificity L-threonine aldolase [Burkholderiales bacterium]|nr:low-specificity L-threonine aldolase [Burkholderiales bacterium]
MTTLVDLRSDTVTRPSPGMRKAMHDAELGDDVFGDDPTVNRLQARAAEIFGVEDALLFPSGTQSNLAALMSHCQRGEEVILGMEAHSYRYEAGGVSVLGSIHPQAIPNRPDGTLDLAQVEAAIKPDDPHFPRTHLLALENTITGRVLPREYMAKAVDLVRRKSLSIHLDGARIFNAATALNTKVKDLCAGFDSVSSCLSKGLGAPAGTVLLGKKEFIQKARRARKILGGGMRQAGVIAAAGLYALENNVQRLKTDHENAERLARGLREIGLEVQLNTNMVLVKIDVATSQQLGAKLLQSEILVLPRAPMRLVTHLDVDAAGIDRALAAFRSFFAPQAARAMQAR